MPVESNRFCLPPDKKVFAWLSYPPPQHDKHEHQLSRQKKSFVTQLYLCYILYPGRGCDACISPEVITVAE